MLSPEIERAGVPGAAFVVVEGDRTTATSAAGVADLASNTPMTVDTAGNWFSMTKIATATAAMMLVERGALDLDALVRTYLGDIWPDAFATARVRHLLNHSSGLRNPLPIRWVHRAGEHSPDPRAWLARLLAKQRKPRFAPGTRASYSNVGYLALGEVIATAAGRPYVAFVTDELLQPLGLRATAFVWSDLEAVPRATGYQQASRALAPLLARMLPRGIVGERSGRFVALNSFELDGAAYGGLIGNVSDAARLLALHCNGGTVGDHTFLSTESVQAMASVDTRGNPYDLGLGWFRPAGTPGPRVQHYGGGMGFWNVLRFDPTTGRGVAVMSNTTRRWDVVRVADDALDT